MLPEGPLTIADIERLAAEAKEARISSQGWPVNFLATINNMVEREPYFSSEPYGPGIKERIDILKQQLDLQKEDRKGDSWDTVDSILVWLKGALKHRDERKGVALQRLIRDARARGQAALAAREPPPVQPVAPMFASAPPADGGRRRRIRSTRRGRKSRRKSLRQRK
jgi:hypothetical protein